MFLGFEAPGTKAMRFRISSVNSFPMSSRLTGTDIRQTLLQGHYRTSPVRKVMIPKPDGSQRELGIPTVVDWLIQ
jgi:retron-type reverse transcriptase